MTSPPAQLTNLAGKLAPQTVWAFALGAVVVGTGLAVALHGLSPKITSLVYAGVVGAAGFASTFSTRARLGAAAVAFVVAAVIAAIASYVVVSHFFAAATTTMVDLTSAGTQHQAAVGMGGVFGSFFGVFAAIIALLETSIVGVLGAFAGSRFKAQLAAGAPVRRQSR